MQGWEGVRGVCKPCDFGWPVQTIERNPCLLSRSGKGEKAAALGYVNRALFLSSPGRSGHIVCPDASPGCRAACLGRTSNWLQLSPAQNAQAWRTDLYFKAPERFFDLLQEELNRLCRFAYRRRIKPAIRLNGSSDLDFTDFIRQNPGIQFYDYTKSTERMERFLAGALPGNYHMTFSRSEINEADCERFMAQGANVAVVFRRQMPSRWRGHSVLDGNQSDLRFLDPRGVPGFIVGLTAWGGARKDRTGFAVDA